MIEVSTSIILTGILVGVTGYYAWTSHRNFKELAKDRKIRFMEKQIEEFYMPYIQNRYLLDTYPWVEHIDRSLAYILHLISTLQVRTYLVSRNIRADVEKYLSKIATTGTEHYEEEVKALRAKVNADIQNDYENILKELEALVQ